MATPEELNEKELLAQAFSQFGSLDAQPGTPDPSIEAQPKTAKERKADAEAFAAEESLPEAIPLPTADTPVDPAQPIPLPSANVQELQADPRQIATLQDLQGNVNRIDELSRQKQEALRARTIADKRRPRTRFVEEGKSFMDAFSNPSEAQRAFAFNAGLALLSSSGTNNLSQRIGQALGSGMQGMQTARQAEIDTTKKEAAARLEQFGIQEEAERDKFKLGVELVKEKRLQDAKVAGPAPSSTSKLFNELEMARKEGNPEKVQVLEDKLKLETRGEMKPVSLDPASTKAVMADLTSMKENVMKTDNMLLEAQRAENALLNAETGTFAKGKFAAKKLGKLFGIKGFEDDISATEALSQVLGGNVLAILSSGDLGAGTGLSDKDVEFARQVAAGTIELTEENIRYAIDVKRRAANYFRSRYSNSVNNYVSAFEDAGKVPVFVSTQQNDLGRYKTVDFKPISKEGQLLFGSEPGTLMQMRETTGVLSPANAAAIGNNVGATPEPVQLNPKFEGVSTADLIGGF